MSEVARLCRYRSLLVNLRVVSAARLIEELEISPATFKRDLAKLRDQLHVPIVFDRDLGGYRLEPGHADSELPGLWFSQDEILALVTIQQMLIQLEPGSGKSHLVKMLRALWTNTPFPDGRNPRDIARLPPSVADALAELDTQARQKKTRLHAASGTLSQGASDSIRKAVLAIVFKASGLPSNYSEARALMWLRNEGIEDAVRQALAHVFSSKLQFVELEIKGAKISRTQLTVPSELLNSDAKGELQGLIRSKLTAFSEFKTVEVLVPAYHNGKPLDGEMDLVSEASLQRTRTALERQFIYDITGHGRLVARDDKKALEAQVDALKVQLLAHSKELKKLIEKQSTEIIDAAIELILARAARSRSPHLPDPAKLREEFQKGLSRGKDEEPKVSLVFKDVTYEQTKNDGFRKLVDKSLPAHKRKQLGK